MPKRNSPTYQKGNVLPRAAGEGVKRRILYMRDTDWAYLAERYGNASEGIRKLVTADRRAFDDVHFKA